MSDVIRVILICLMLAGIGIFVAAFLRYSYYAPKDRFKSFQYLKQDFLSEEELPLARKFTVQMAFGFLVAALSYGFIKLMNFINV